LFIKGQYKLQNAITIQPEFNGPNERRDYILIYSCRLTGKSHVNISQKMFSKETKLNLHVILIASFTHLNSKNNDQFITKWPHNLSEI